MIIQSKRVWVVNTWLAAQIETEEGKIVNIYPYGEKDVDEDYGDKRIIPGFIDVHTHGAYGFDTNDAKEEGLRNWMKNIVKEGVTGILPTTITQSEEVLTNAVKNVAKVVEEGYEGAEILGIHFEGPYLDQVYKGAQPEQYCVKPDVEQFKRYLAASNNLIKIVTMACEHDDNFELTKFLRSHGIVCSQGHSGATFEQARLAIANGANSMTHVFNGMTKFHHREPGLVGAAMRYRDVYGEIICDGIELYPDGSAHLTDTKGLAGSTLHCNDGLRILVEKAMIPWQTAINACTLNPARMLNVDDRKGSIQTGKDADLVVLNDDYSVEMTYVKGKKAF